LDTCGNQASGAQELKTYISIGEKEGGKTYIQLEGVVGHGVAHTHMLLVALCTCESRATGRKPRETR